MRGRDVLVVPALESGVLRLSPEAFAYWSSNDGRMRRHGRDVPIPMEDLPPEALSVSTVAELSTGDDAIALRSALAKLAERDLVVKSRSHDLNITVPQLQLSCRGSPWQLTPIGAALYKVVAPLLPDDTDE